MFLTVLAYQNAQIRGPSLLLQKPRGYVSVAESVSTFEEFKFVTLHKASFELFKSTSQHHVPPRHPFHTADYVGTATERHHFLVS